MNTYRDQAKCPKGHSWIAIRRKTSAGCIVTTYCFRCDKSYKMRAGAVDAGQRPTT